jgi:hypothetical protein
MHDPISDTIRFLVGAAPDYNAFGAARYIAVLYYLLLIIGSFAVAWRNWSTDATQRTPKHIAIWLMRLLAAGMWYQGALWKIPLPVSGAFMWWTGALAKFTAFPPHAWLVTTVFLPHIALIQPLVFTLEMTFALAFSLGLFVRFFGVVAVLFTAHLWIGLYNDPTEWPWTYIAIMVSHGMFVTSEAGRSLGLDNLLRRANPAILRRHRTLERAFLLAS